MTKEEREEAIYQLERCIHNAKVSGNKYSHFELAIEALKAEPCEDAISRQAVCNIIDDIRDCVSVNGYWAFLERLKKLPPVNPQPKTGHWITQCNVVHQKEYYYCSECREEFSYDGETGIKMNDYDYCPNCGAKMEDSDADNQT